MTSIAQNGELVQGKKTVEMGQSVGVLGGGTTLKGVSAAQIDDIYKRYCLNEPN
jgi:hypothetical protein